MQRSLSHLNNLYGINVCGEGGEYETLTLDCPLFKNFKIVLDEYDIILHSPDNIAPVGVLHPLKFHLEHKSFDSLSEQMPSLTSWVQEVEENNGESGVQRQKGDACIPLEIVHHCLHDKSELDLHITSSKQHASFAILSCWMNSSIDANGTEHELDSVLTSIAGELEKDNIGWGDVLYIHLYIDDMGAFTQANQTYMQHITDKLCIAGVPSRSTVELALMKSNLGRVLVEVIAARHMNKKVLHVQSISCWAPSCIGPYSQATLHKGMLYMAGQLGLDPPTMLLISGGAASEMNQALLNCEAVAQVFSASVVQSAISILIYCSSSAGLSERNKIETTLDKFLAFLKKGDSSGAGSSKIPVLYVQVPALPKGAMLEVEPFLYVPSCNESCDDEGLLIRRISDQVCQGDFSISHGSIVAGHACRAFFSISVGSKLESSVKDSICSGAVHTLPLDSFPEYLQGGLKSCLEAFSKLLAEACLCWEDVLAVRVLFVAEMLSLGSIVEIWNQALAEVLLSLAWSNKEEPHIFCSTAGLSALEPLFLPVLGAGQNSNMHDIITLDVLALR